MRNKGQIKQGNRAEAKNIFCLGLSLCLLITQIFSARAFADTAAFDANSGMTVQVKSVTVEEDAEEVNEVNQEGDQGQEVTIIEANNSEFTEAAPIEEMNSYDNEFYNDNNLTISTRSGSLQEDEGEKGFVVEDALWSLLEDSEDQKSGSDSSSQNGEESDSHDNNENSEEQKEEQTEQKTAAVVLNELDDETSQQIQAELENEDAEEASANNMKEVVEMWGEQVINAMEEVAGGAAGGVIGVASEAFWEWTEESVKEENQAAEEPAQKENTETEEKTESQAEETAETVPAEDEAARLTREQEIAELFKKASAIFTSIDQAEIVLKPADEESLQSQADKLQDKADILWREKQDIEGIAHELSSLEGEILERTGQVNKFIVQVEARADEIAHVLSGLRKESKRQENIKGIIAEIEKLLDGVEKAVSRVAGFSSDLDQNQDGKLDQKDLDILRRNLTEAEEAAEAVQGKAVVVIKAIQSEEDVVKKSVERALVSAEKFSGRLESAAEEIKDLIAVVKQELADAIRHGQARKELDNMLNRADIIMIDWREVSAAPDQNSDNQYTAEDLAELEKGYRDITGRMNLFESELYPLMKAFKQAHAADEKIIGWAGETDKKITHKYELLEGLKEFIRQSIINVTEAVQEKAEDRAAKAALIQGVSGRIETAALQLEERAAGKKEGEASAYNGITWNGMTWSGFAANGLAANGLAANGLFANGLAANGLAANGLAANGLAANGVAADGLFANGLAVNGLTANGLAANGLFMKELSDSASHTLRIYEWERMTIETIVPQINDDKDLVAELNAVEQTLEDRTAQALALKEIVAEALAEIKRISVQQARKEELLKELAAWEVKRETAMRAAGEWHVAADMDGNGAVELKDADALEALHKRAAEMIAAFTDESMPSVAAVDMDETGIQDEKKKVLSAIKADIETLRNSQKEIMVALQAAHEEIARQAAKDKGMQTIEQLMAGARGEWDAAQSAVSAGDGALTQADADRLEVMEAGLNQAEKVQIETIAGLELLSGEIAGNEIIVKVKSSVEEVRGYLSGLDQLRKHVRESITRVRSAITEREKEQPKQNPGISAEEKRDNNEEVKEAVSANTSVLDHLLTANYLSKTTVAPPVTLKELDSSPMIYTTTAGRFSGMIANLTQSFSNLGFGAKNPAATGYVSRRADIKPTSNSAFSASVLSPALSRLLDGTDSFNPLSMSIDERRRSENPVSYYLNRRGAERRVYRFGAEYAENRGSGKKRGYEFGVENA